MNPATRPVRSDLPVRWAVLVLALAQAIAPYLSEILHAGRPIGGPENGLPRPPLIPAGYAFIIWLPIFVGCIAYAVWQVLPRRRGDRPLAALAPWAGAAFLTCVAWSLVAQFWINWLTVPIFIGILACLLAGMASYRREGLLDHSWRPQFLVLAPLGVYAGWSSVAIIANTSTVLADLGFGNLGLSLSTFSAVLAGVGGVILLSLIARMPRNFWFLGAATWALIAIIVENVSRHQAWTVSVVAGLIAAGAAIVNWRFSPRLRPDRTP